MKVTINLSVSSWVDSVGNQCTLQDAVHLRNWVKGIFGRLIDHSKCLQI